MPHAVRRVPSASSSLSPRGWPGREGGGWAASPAPGWEGSADAARRPQEPATAGARPCYSVCARVLTRSPCHKPQQFLISGGAREAGEHFCLKQEQVNGGRPTPALPFITGTGCDSKARGRKGIVVLGCRQVACFHAEAAEIHRRTVAARRSGPHPGRRRSRRQSPSHVKQGPRCRPPGTMSVSCNV